MKKLSIILLACLFGKIVSAQTTNPAREIGLQFNSLNSNSSFSAFYKKQVKENVHNRVRLAVGNLGFGRDSNENDFVNFAATIAVGREKRKQLDRKLTFYRGYEFSASTQLNSYRNNESLYANIGAGLVFGLQHQFNDLWAINMETIPSVGIGFRSNEDNWKGNVNVGLSNLVSLGIVRCF